MKKFILQFSLFIAPLVIPFVVLCIYFNISSKKKIENYTFPNTIHKIVIGDSHTRLAIKDGYLNNTINMSQNSEGLIYSYFKLKAFFKANPQIDTVFLGAGYHTFAGYYDDHILLPDIASRYFFILPTAIQIELIKTTKSPGLLIAKSFISGFKNTIHSKESYSFLGKYENYATKVSINNTSVNNRIKNAYFTKGKVAGFSSSNIFYYYKIVQLCKKNKIVLYILNTPMHNKYRELVPIEFKNKYYSLIKSKDVILFEFDSLNLSNNDFLPDGDHLSEQGATTASGYLKEKIINHQ